MSKLSDKVQAGPVCTDP